MIVINKVGKFKKLTEKHQKRIPSPFLCDWREGSRTMMVDHPLPTMVTCVCPICADFGSGATHEPEDSRRDGQQYRPGVGGLRFADRLSSHLHAEQCQRYVQCSAQSETTFINHFTYI